jgi:hypothetical protein
MGTRSTRQVRGLVAGALLLAGAALEIASPPAAGAATKTRVTVVGDSTLLGMRADGAALIRAGYDLNLQAASCRRLIEVSCDIPFRPPNTIDVLRAQVGQLGSVLVVMAGYDDYAIADGIDTIVAEARRQGLVRVVWLTYMEDVSYTGLGGQTYADVFRAHNRVLRDKAAAESLLAVADWNAHADPHPEWFSSDGIHLSGAGSVALGAYITAELDALGLSRCAAAAAGGDPVPAGAPAAPATGATGFAASTPTRLLDTRAGGSPLGAGRQFEIDVTDHTRPGSTAVAVNLTAAPACAAGFVTAYPCGGGSPLASNLNTLGGRVAAAHAVVPLTAGRRSFCVMSSTQTELVVDLMGAYQPGAPPLVPSAPRRLVDTRTAGARLAAGATLAVRVPAGRDVTAVLNVTMTDAVSPGFLTAYPADGTTGACDSAARPLASALNADAGATRANLVQVATGGITVCVYANVATHVVVDMTAEHSIGGTELMRAITPTRLVDTRTGTGAPVAGGSTLAVRVPQAGATAAALTVTGVGAAGPGFVTAWPADAAGRCTAADRPLASVLNVAGPDPVPNLAIVAVGGGGTVCLYPQTAMHLVVDQAAWFAAVS